MSTQHSQEFIGRTLQRAYRQTHARLVHELRAMGYTDITPSQAEVLSYITDHGCSIVALAKMLGITKQAAGEMVKQLESLGYVTKDVSVTDARSYVVVLDKRGKQLIKDAARLKKAIESEYSQRLGEQEFKALTEALKIIS
jgi:DNA-binding MarR family transcriptional regulator